MKKDHLLKVDLSLLNLATNALIHGLKGKVATDIFSELKYVDNLEQIKFTAIDLGTMLGILVNSIAVHDREFVDNVWTCAKEVSNVEIKEDAEISNDKRSLSLLKDS